MEDDITTTIPPENPDDMSEDAALVYPVPEEKRLSVSTPIGTPPEETDQGDEEVTREQSGIPE